MEIRSRLMNIPTDIVLHCSVTPDESTKQFDVEDIRQWHRDRGWDDVGYHYVIKRDGTIQIGRLESVVGAHVKGYNENKLAICFIGTEYFTSDQYDSLDRLYLDIFNRYGISADQVKGHYEYPTTKTCPNLDMEIIRGRLWKLLQQEFPGSFHI